MLGLTTGCGCELLEAETADTAAEELELELEYLGSLDLAGVKEPGVGKDLLAV